MDARIIATLLDRFPDFRRAYEADGMVVAEEFDDVGRTRLTSRQFLEADAALDALIRDILIPVP